MSSILPPGKELQNIHKLLDTNFPYFAKKVLKIKDKESGIITDFGFNSAQEYLHKKIEEQIKDIGKVRVLIVKGRQQGCSTYVEGRFYWRAVRHKNKAVFILSHLSKTTRELFKMVERFYELSPEPTRPEAKTQNRQEFQFKKINSEYSVGTAGSDDVGRGGNVNLFHGSEVAFWENATGIKTGILQSVPGGPGSEIILESTANGMANDFYVMCMDALEKRGDYRVIFIPWYWQDEYSRDTPADGIEELTEEEEEYRHVLHHPYTLSKEQLYWRRAKIIEFGEGGSWMFRQEYPAFLLDAFQTSGKTLISAQSIIRARTYNVEDEEAPLILGVDPARTIDRIILAPRQGRHYWPFIELSFGKSEEQIQMKIAGAVAEWIRKNNPQKVFIDVGYGWGVIDRLHELGFRAIVEGVNFGQKATATDIYLNKRAEMWNRMADHIHGEEGPVNLPDDDFIQRDLMSMPEAIATSSGKKKMMDKETIKKNFGMSPDVGDAYALTHAFYVHKDIGNQIGVGVIKKKEGTGSTLKTFQRVRGYNNRSSSITAKRRRK